MYVLIQNIFART